MRILLTLLLACSAWATSITSTSTGGNWADTGTWAGNVVPVPGDTVIISNGATVTIPSGTTVTIGSSPADDTGTPAIQCASTTGTGILAVNGTLIFRGPVRECNAVWTAGAGAKLLHDSSQAATPASANYTWQVGMANAQVGSKLVVTGTSGNRATIGTANANGTVCSAGGSCDSGQAGGIKNGAASASAYGNFQCYYCDISNWGLATTFLVTALPSSGSVSDIRGIVFEHTIIDHCGPILVPSGIVTNTWFRFYAVVIKNPVVDSNGRSVILSNAAGLASGVTCADCRFENTSIEGEVFVGVASTGLVNPGFVVKNALFRGGVSASDPPLVMGRMTFSAGNWDQVWLENRVQSSSDSGNVPGGTLNRTIYTISYATNPHFVFAASVDALHDGFIAQSEFDNGNNGDLFQVSPNSGVAAYSMTFRNGLLLPTPGGQSVGTFTNISGTTLCNGTSTFCPAISVVNNTYVTGNASAIGATGESNVGAAGMYPLVTNNIVWRPASGIGYVAAWSSGQVAAAGLFTSADYNWQYNLSNSGSNAYYGYPSINPGQYASTPGTHDQSGSPQFVDSSRDVITFGKVYFPSFSTIAEVAGEVRKNMEDGANGGSTGNANITIQNMYDWIRAGFRAQNTATWSAASDGGYVGAINPITFSGSVTGRLAGQAVIH